jgi:uncharacterized protein YqjF (DUF2071 family)
MTEPLQPAFLTARWHHLAMLNFEVDPAALAPRVPLGTELDLWQGRCLVSLVGFQFLDTRVRGMGFPMHRDFPEVNLRFYVRREADGELRRGVVFVREIVPRWAIASIANALYGERYLALPMAFEDQLLAPPHALAYRWRRGDAWYGIALRVEGEAQRPDPASEEAFITEHYWGYASQRDGSTLEYRVDHPPWEVWRGLEPQVSGEVGAFYGEPFGAFLQGAPSSCFVATGSEIIVRRGVLI